MYKGFKLEGINFRSNSSYFKKGQDLYQANSAQIRKSLDSFFLNDNSLDGAKIIDSWFPSIKANVFISHSHKDETMAIAFAGWLHENFGITSFIDSCIWGYSNDLIRILDNEYSWLNKETNTYNYDKVLDSTSHVHMMLSTALSMMIDKTECLIFLDTPNSIKPYGTADKTESPWIYSEIAFSQIVKITIPKRKLLENELLEREVFSKRDGGSIEKAIIVKYPIYSNHLTDITTKTLIDWNILPKSSNAEAALDKLYALAKPKSVLID